MLNIFFHFSSIGRIWSKITNPKLSSFLLFIITILPFFSPFYIILPFYPTLPFLLLSIPHYPSFSSSYRKKGRSVGWRGEGRVVLDGEEKEG